jgi:hypothetical protein
LLITDVISVDCHHDSRITVPQLLLNGNHCCTVCEQRTGRPVAHGMEATALNFQLLYERMQLFLPQLVRLTAACMHWALLAYPRDARLDFGEKCPCECLAGHLTESRTAKLLWP